MPHILFVNPWIYDFAAYDVWAKPLGLLTLAALARQHGLDVSYIDCVARFHPRAGPGDPRERCGRGPYLKTPVPKPASLATVRRTYSRYGIPHEWFMQDLAVLPKPDLVMMTGLMTYWYPGVVDAIRRIKKIYPDVPVVLGGIYATLCRPHAKAHTGAARVVAGPGEAAMFDLFEEMLGCRCEQSFDPDDLDTFPYPAYDLEHAVTCVPLMTSRGCPFSCDYCASRLLAPKRMARSPRHVAEEIRFWHHKYGVLDFVFYDDALLADAGNHIIPLLEEVIESGLKVRFHTPNAVHIRPVTKELAHLMYRAGFETLRLGLETFDFKCREMDHKVKQEEFFRAASYLKEAGFQKKQVGAYLLAGLPGQDLAVLEESIRAVHAAGVTPIPAYYTPIPGTPMWGKAVAASRYNLNADPLLTNNAVMPCQPGDFDWGVLSRIKALVQAY